MLVVLVDPKAPYSLDATPPAVTAHFDVEDFSDHDVRDEIGTGAIYRKMETNSQQLFVSLQEAICNELRIPTQRFGCTITLSS